MGTSRRTLLATATLMVSPGLVDLVVLQSIIPLYKLIESFSCGVPSALQLSRELWVAL